MKKNAHIMTLVHRALERAGIHYQKPENRCFTVLRCIYYVGAGLSVLMVIGMLIGQILYASSANESKKELNVMIPYLAYHIGALLITLAGLVLTRLKKYYIAGICTFSGTIMTLLRLGFKDMIGTNLVAGLNPDFWWRHFLPGLVSLIGMGGMVLILLIADYYENRTYKQIVSRVYEQFGRADLAPDEWERFLSTYNPRHQKNAGKPYRPLVENADDELSDNP